MNKDQLYQEFLSNGGNASPEEFYAMMAEFNPEIADTEKKKDNPNLTTPTSIPESLPNTTNIPMGSEQDLAMMEQQIQLNQNQDSSALGITLKQPSMELLLENGASSVTGSGELAQQPTYKPFDPSQVIYPIGNDEIAERNRFVDNQNRQISPAQNELFSASNDTIKKTLTPKSSILFGDDINQESVINEDGSKAFTKIEGYGYLPNYVLPDPKEGKELLFDRDGNLNKWIKESAPTDRADLTPAPFNGIYSVSLGVATDAEKKLDNANILKRYEAGVIDIEKKDGNPVYKDGLLKWKITDKNFYDNTYLPYIAKVNSQRQKKSEEEGLNKVYHDRGLIDKPNTEFENVLDEYEKVFGKKPTDEDILSIQDEATLNAFRINIEFERLKKDNPNADINSLYQQAEYKYSKTYTPIDLQTANNVLSLLRESFQANAQLSEDNPLLQRKDNSERAFRDEDKEEFEMFQSLSADERRRGLFGKWWKEEGELEYGSTFVRQKRLENQDTRMEMVSSFNDWLERDANILMEAKYNRIKDARFKTQQAVQKKDNTAIETNASNTIALLNDYTEFGNQYKERQNEFKKVLGTFRRTQDKIFNEEQIKANFLSGEDKPAQYAANFALGIASSLQDTVTGVARLASLPLGQGNVSDFIDDLSQDISIGGYKSAPLSLNIKRYEGGTDEGGKYEYRDVNGTNYIYRPETERYDIMLGKIPKYAKFIDKEAEYTVAGFVFQGSKMATDILATSAMGSLINKGIGSVASKTFKFSRASTLVNTKNLTAVFGAESPLAKSSAALYKASRNTSNISVTGWIPQMTEDSYQTGKDAGLTGNYLSAYTVFNAGLQSLIQRINPDIKFLRGIKTDHDNLLSALLSKNTDKALLYFNNIKSKVGNNAARETIEETTQQITQDFTNLFTNALTGSKLKFSTTDDYRDVLVSTPILAGVMGATMGRNGKSTAKVRGTEYDLSQLNKSQLATLAALSTDNDGFIKDYINTALFQSVKKRGEELLSEVQTRRKYINQIPNSESHSIQAVTEVAPILQEIDRQKTLLKQDDGTFAERINAKISELTSQANAILDNDLTQESPTQNAENPQSAPQQETVQTEVATEAKTNQPEYATNTESSVTNDTTTQPEPTAVEEAQNIPADVKPIRQLGDGSNVYYESDKYRVNDSMKGNVLLNVGEEDSLSPLTSIEFDNAEEAVYVANKLNEALPNGLTRDYHNVDNIIQNLKQEFKNEKQTQQEGIVAGTPEQSADTTNETSETSRNAETAQTQEVEQESPTQVVDINEEDTDAVSSYADDFLKAMQEQDNVGEKNAVNTEPTESPTLAENQYELNGKVYTKTDNGDFTVENKNGVQQKVTNKTTVEKLNTLADAKREESVTDTREKNGYTYKRYSDGTEVIINSKGQSISSKNKKGKTNANFAGRKAMIFGDKTETEIKAENRQRTKEAIDHFYPSNPEDAARLYFARGGKVKAESISKEVLGNSDRLLERGKAKRKLTDFRWAYLGDKADKTITQVAEKLHDEYPHIEENDIRSALIDVINSYGSATEIQEEIVSSYNQSVDPYYGFTEEDIRAMEYNELPEQAKAMVDAVESEATLSEAEKFEYEKSEYEKQIQSLSDEQQEQIYNDIYNRNQRPEPQNESVQGSVAESDGNQKADTNSPEYRQLIEERTRAENEVKSAQENLDRVSKNTNNNFQADQENLFGERPAQQGMFDERANGDAGKNIIADAKNRLDNAKKNLSAINKRIKDFESGKTGGTGEMQFDDTVNSAKTTSKIDDFGEKIGGAKKDLRQQLESVSEDDIRTLPLSKSFPRPDFKKLVDSGVITKEQAVFLKFIYDEIPAKPRKSYLVNNWANKVKYVIDTFSSLMDNGNIDVVGRIRESSVLGSQFKLYEEIHNEFGFPENDVAMGGFEIKSLVNQGGQYYAVVKGSRIVGKDMYSVKDAVDYVKTLTNKNKEQKGSVKLSLYQDTKTKKYFIGKKGAIGTVRLIEFDDVAEGRAFLNNNQEQLQEMWESQKETQKERDGRVNEKRIGTDYRKGENITPEKFSSTFGFRGVEFGNWVNNKERQDGLNEAYDALMDLATVTGISPKAISLNGELGLAFGARGSGNASAHYEPTKVVINLTKTKGAGSLAHEWWHAVDNYFSRQRGLKDEMMTDSPRYKGKEGKTIREEVADAFTNVVKVINSSPLKNRSKKADAARSKPYFSTIVEMTARSFENYVVLKLAETGERNHYLANYREHSEWIKGSTLSEDSYPYPLEAESSDINKAYNDLFSTLKEKQVGDNIALFQKTDANFTPLPVSAFNALIDKLKKAFAKAFKNLNVTYDLEKATQRAKELGENVTDLEFKTKSGDVYGFKLSDGTIYINPEKLNANTAIHEFSHLWEQIMPNAWKKGVELFKDTKTGKELFAKLKSEGNYANLSDQQLWSEAVNTHIGNIGDKRYANPRGKMKEFADWFKTTMAKFLNAIGIKNNWTAETRMAEFTDKVLGDLLGDKVLNAEKSPTQRNDVQYSFLSESDFDADGNVKPEVLAEIEAERNQIKSEAQSNGTWLKATNGKATNLNEQQWVDVRTKRFTDWFGDWENNPSEASKVVDDNGEPMVVYHGGSKFNEFKSQAESYRGNSTDKGIYFTTNLFVAQDTYALDYELLQRDAKNDWEGVSEDELNSGEWNSNSFKYAEVKEVFLNLKNPSIFESLDAGLIPKNYEEGKDGLIAWQSKDGNLAGGQIVVFNPNQIKSATSNAGTYSAGTGNINYSIQPNELPKHKNLIPFKSLTEVTERLKLRDEAGAKVALEASAWYQNSSQKVKDEINNGGVKQFAIDQVLKHKENADIKAKAKVEETVLKTKQQEKAKAEKTIEKLKERYDKRIEELKNNAMSLKQKQAQRKLLVQQTVRDLKSLLINNGISGKITPTEISRLIKAASEISASAKPTKALNDFFQLYTSIQADAQSRLKDKQMTRAQYDELKNFVEALYNNGVNKDTILNQVKLNEFSFSKKGVLTNETARQTEKIIKHLETDANSDAEELFDGAYKMSKDAEKKSFFTRLKENPLKALGDFAVKVIEDYTDRGFRVKEMFRKMDLGDVNMGNIYNRFINASGSSSVANAIHDKHFNKIFAGLSLADRENLDKLIVARRIIAIEENRATRDLPPIQHTNGITLYQSQQYVEKLKAKDVKMSADLNKRADAYFLAFNEQLDRMLESGIISQEAYDAVNGVEYQPRKFLEHMADYQGVVEEGIVGDNYNTGKKSVSAEPIKTIDEGSEGAQVMNADWLLRIAIASNTRLTAMNEVNSSFMTKEFPKAKIKAEEIRNKTESDRTTNEKRFLRAFNQMSEMVKDNPIVGVTSSGNPKYKESSAPTGFTKNYYFVNGVRNEFFIADEISDIWNDIYDKPLSKGIDKSKILSTIFRLPTATVKYLATGINPLFAIANTPRDFFQVINFSNAYSNIVPVAVFQLGRDSIRAYREIHKSRKGDANTMIEKATQYGIKMDFLYIQGQFENQTRKESKVSKFLDKMNVLSQYSELGTRIATFSKMVDNGLKQYNKDNGTNFKSVEEITNKYDADNIYHAAVATSRTVMDFNQGGKKTKDLDTFIPYLNASVQGTRSMVDALRKDPINTTSKILQTGAMMTGAMVSLAMMALGDDDDDENGKSAMEKYLDFIERMTPTQKMNYWNVPISKKLAEKLDWLLPEKKDNNEYYVLKMAKTQALTPFLYAMEEATYNVMRKIVGRETKNFGDIASGTLGTANKNMLPFEVGSPAETVFGVINKVPVGKAGVLWVTGYDAYKDELLSSDIGKVVKGAEGLSNDNVEDFYKSLGKKYGISPVRTKAVIEAFVTSPQTNPYVSLAYFGANSVDNFVGKKDREYISEKMLNDANKLFTGRIVSQTSAYAVSLSQKTLVQDSEKLQKIGMEDAQLNADKKKWAKDLANGRMNEDELNKMVSNLNKTGNEKENIYKSVIERAENNDIDAIILDIKYDDKYRSAKAKAQKLVDAYPQYDFRTDKSAEAMNKIMMMEQIGGIITDDVNEYYNMLMDEKKKSK